MRALVTGGGGFLGGAVVRLLRARGDAARSFTRSRYPWLDELGVEQALGDLARPADVERAVAGPKTFSPPRSTRSASTRAPPSPTRRAVPRP